ncbi:hypothetical protein [Labrys neptuniae]
MEIHKSPTPSGYTIFADALSQSEDGKLNVFGIYHLGMQVQSIFPVTLASFVAITNLILDENFYNLDLILEIHFPGDAEGKPRFSNNLRFDGGMWNLKGADGLLHVPLPLFVRELRIEAEGEIRVLLNLGDRKIEVGNLHIASDREWLAKKDENVAAS